MAFDPGKAFELVEETPSGFDPAKEFSVVAEGQGGFDPSKEFEVVDAQPPAPLDPYNAIGRGMTELTKIEKGSFNEAFQPPQVVKETLDKLFPSFKPESPEIAQLVQMAGLEPTRQVAEAVSERIKGAIGSILSPGGAVLAVAAPAAPVLAGGVAAVLGGEAVIEGTKEALAGVEKGSPGMIAGGATTAVLGAGMTVAGAAGVMKGVAETVRGVTPESAKALESVVEGERIKDATQEGQVKADVQRERAGADALGTTAEAGAGDSLRGQAAGAQEAAKVGEAPLLPTAEATLTQPELFPSTGPGAASPGDFPKTSELSQLTETVKGVETVKAPLGERVRSELSQVYEQITDKAETAIGNLKALGAQAMEVLRGKPEWTDFKDALGKFSGRNNRNDYELQQFTREIRKSMPDRVRREALVNWIQADGDKAVLAERAAKSGAVFKRGYEVAQELTPDEMTLAGNVRSYLDAKLQEGIEAGLLTAGLENYVTQIWDRPNPVVNKLMGEAISGKLAPNFRFARQRIFESYFEGEQAGFKPKLKDIGALIAAYDQSFSRAIAGRNLIKSLHEGVASDGRPLVEVSGVSSLLAEKGAPEALLIKPRVKPEELADYRPIDHPSLRGWKWAGTDAETGASILFQGDMLVHPEVYRHLKNILSSCRRASSQRPSHSVKRP